MTNKKNFGGSELEFDLVIGATAYSATAAQNTVLGSYSEAVVGEYVIGGVIMDAVLKPWRDEIWMRDVTDAEIIVDLSNTSTTRLRKLADMDGSTLSAFDGMQITSVDYITI